MRVYNSRANKVMDMKVVAGGFQRERGAAATKASLRDPQMGRTVISVAETGTCMCDKVFGVHMSRYDAQQGGEGPRIVPGLSHCAACLHSGAHPDSKVLALPNIEIWAHSCQAAGEGRWCWNNSGAGIRQLQVLQGR